jgi:hypothetical protein
MNKSLNQVAAIGMKNACHLLAKWAAPNSPIAPKGEKLGICGMSLEKAASKIITINTLVLMLIF